MSALKNVLVATLVACCQPCAFAADVPKAAATDALGTAMEEAKAELAARKSWAKDIPPVMETRRKGGTLLIGIGTPIPADSTQWKSWWEQTLCEAPELKKILLLDGGVLVFSGAEPIASQGVFFNKASCYKRIPGWNAKDAENTQSPLTSGTEKTSYKVEPTKPLPAAKPQNDDPLGLVTTFTKLNDIVVENQLRTAEKPETASRIAVFKKNLYTALLKQGFTKAEAISIVNNTAIPSLWR